MLRPPISTCFIFFNDTATTEIYTLSLHDALPIFAKGTRMKRLAASAISLALIAPCLLSVRARRSHRTRRGPRPRDRKSTRLNSSHANISYAVFCLKKQKYQLSVLLLLLSNQQRNS